MCDCSDSITNGAVPVAATVGPNLTLSNLYVGNVFANFISVSNILIPDSPAIPGYVLETTGTSIAWVPQTGGSGGSQWVGTIGNPIYYSKPVGIGSSATPTATLMVTGNIYASNAVQTPRLITTTANIATLNVTGAVTFSNVSANGAGLSSMNASNLTFGVVNSSLIYGNTLSNISGSNVTTGINASNVTTGILSSSLIFGNTLSNISGSNVTTGINASNVTTGILSSSRIYGNTLSNISGSNVTTGINASNVTTGILSSSLIFGNTLSNISGSNVTTGINASNVTTGILSSSLIFGNTISNIQSSNVTQPFANLAVSNSVTTANITATRGMGVGTYAGSAAPANSLIVSGNLGLGKNNPGYQLDMTGSAVIGGNLVIQTGGAMANPFEVRGSVAIGTYAGVDAAPSNGLIVSGNTGIGTNAPGYLLDVAGYMRAGAIVDSASSIGSAGQVLTSTGSTLEWSSAVANLVVSNTVTTSEIICNAFTTSTATNWNYISNAASARSTSVGWEGIRQVFGDQVSRTIYIYNNAVLEISFTEIGLPQFGAFVAVGGAGDAIIVVSGVDCFYFYYNDGIVWNGPYTINTDEDLGATGAIWMPSMSSGNTVVLGAYGWGASGGNNTNVGIYSIDGPRGTASFVRSINMAGNRNTVAISGDETTLVIGQQLTSTIYIYLLSNLVTPVFTGLQGSSPNFGVSIDYYGHVVLLTLFDLNQVIMFSDNLRPV
jgi:hypothetical protein